MPNSTPSAARKDAHMTRMAGNLFLYSALAVELREIRRLVESIAETLVSDPRFVEDYLQQLQYFDLVIQRTDESADLLDRLAGGSQAHDAIAAVRLSSVQARLRDALAGS
ncbi:MAG: hypothetical protein RIS17_1857 [Pseudomonadota bacterium]